jgi:hypothetical protein
MRTCPFRPVLSLSGQQPMALNEEAWHDHHCRARCRHVQGPRPARQRTGATPMTSGDRHPGCRLGLRTGSQPTAAMRPRCSATTPNPPGSITPTCAGHCWRAGRHVPPGRRHTTGQGRNQSAPGGGLTSREAEEAQEALHAWEGAAGNQSPVVRRGAELQKRALEDLTTAVSRTPLERDVGSAREEQRGRAAVAAEGDGSAPAHRGG